MMLVCQIALLRTDFLVKEKWSGTKQFQKPSTFDKALFGETVNLQRY